MRGSGNDYPEGRTLTSLSWSVWRLLFGSLVAVGLALIFWPVAEGPAPRGGGTRPIESLRVGERVLARNPEIAGDERAGWVEPDWRRWVKLSAVMPKPDGSELHIELLRSPEWLRSQLRYLVDRPPLVLAATPSDPADTTVPAEAAEAETSHSSAADRAGSAFIPLHPVWLSLQADVAAIEAAGGHCSGLTIQLDLPELGLTGQAIVTDITTSPRVQSGGGRVVTGTFAHTSGSVIDLVIADASDQSETLGTTGNHPFWSVDRAEYVQAASLELGERLLTYHGETKRVVSKLARPGPQPVYNLEVHAEHVYFVGQHGVLVHNSQGYGGAPDSGLKLSSKASELYKRGKVRETLDVHYEDLVRRRTGGASQVINGREIDAVTGDALIQVKRSWSAIGRPRNFLGKSTRNQIKATISLAQEQGKRAEFWFKYGVHPEVRSYIESHGGIVRLGVGE